MIRDSLKQLMAGLFHCDVADISDETGPGELPGWDSLGHVSLMVEIQNRLGTHIPVEDALEIESVNDLVVLVERLQSETA